VRLTLRARLLVVPAVVVTGAVALSTLLEHDAQRRWLVARESDALARLTHEAARTAEASGGSWQPFADSLDARFALRATLIAADGTVLADSRARAGGMENHAGREEVRAALAGRPGFGIRRSATVGTEYLYCAVPLAPPREGAAVLRLAEPLEVVGHLGESLTRVSTASAALALLVSILVLAYVSGRFARRLLRLQAVARRIGEGDTAVRAPETPRDDLGQLGRTLNEMRGQLETRLDALRRERDDRERILAHMSDGVALLDGSDRVVHVNHRFAELLDAAWRPEPGTPFTDFARIPELLGMLAESRRAARTLERELKPWATRAGSARATVTPLGDGPAEPVLIVLHDLSESEALQRMRQDFVANVSHELRTPLTTLRGYAETLLEGGLDDAAHREGFVVAMRDGAVRLQALVEDLLALAELERPDATVRREPLDLRALAAEHVEHVRGAAEQAGLALELEPGEPLMVTGDRVRLAQVLANLLDNAVKYTERGSVRVVLGADGERAWCEVRDTGPGIPARDLPRVFERFYRVDKARARERAPGGADRTGTGLGLSIVKHALALLGGEVSVVSRVGEGTTFRFEVPLESKLPR
jgi:two-component system phosphate regulon sensor histidine kinase PhoR